MSSRSRSSTSGGAGKGKKANNTNSSSSSSSSSALNADSSLHPFAAHFWPITRAPPVVPAATMKHSSSSATTATAAGVDTKHEEATLVTHSTAAQRVMHDLQYVLRYLRNASEAQRITKEKQMLKDFEKQQELMRLAHLQAQEQYKKTQAQAIKIASLYRCRRAREIVANKRKQLTLERALSQVNRFLNGVRKLQTLYRVYRVRLFLSRQGITHIARIPKYTPKPTETGKSSKPMSIVATTGKTKKVVKKESARPVSRSLSTITHNEHIERDLQRRTHYQRVSLLTRVQEEHCEALQTLSANIVFWQRESERVERECAHYEKLREEFFNTHRERQTALNKENLSATDRQRKENDAILRCLHIRFERMNERLENARNLRWWVAQHLRVLFRKRAWLPLRLQETIAQLVFIAREHARLERVRVHCEYRLGELERASERERERERREKREKEIQEAATTKKSNKNKDKSSDKNNEKNENKNENNKNNEEVQHENETEKETTQEASTENEEKEGEKKKTVSFADDEKERDQGKERETKSEAKRLTTTDKAEEKEQSAAELMQAPQQWLRTHMQLLRTQQISLDAQQESLLREELALLERERYEIASFDALLQELAASLHANDRLLAERVSLDQQLVRMGYGSPEAVSANQRLLAIKAKQKHIATATIDAIKGALQEKHDAHDNRIMLVYAFPQDRPDLPIAEMHNITAVALEPYRPKSHFHCAQFLQVYALQPWLAAESVEDIRFEERINAKEIKRGTLKEELKSLSARERDNEQAQRVQEERVKAAEREIELFTDPVEDESDLQREKREEALENAKTELFVAQQESESLRRSYEALRATRGPLRSSIEQVTGEIKEVSALLKKRVKIREK